MKNLISKQHTNDGGYHIKSLVDEANGRLKQTGKQGKRATIVAKKSSLSLQFTFRDGNGRPQKNVGLGGIPLSPNGILDAEKIAQMVTNQLVANQFTWDWFNSLIGKPTSEQVKQLTCREMVEEYKKHFFKQRTGNRSPENDWYVSSRYLEKALSELDKPISLPLVRKVVESTKNNTDARATTLNGLANLLKYFDNNDYKKIIKEYKSNNKIKRKTRNVPSDEKIIEIYREGFEKPFNSTRKHAHRYPQWRFLYTLLATYGLRIHEAWHIANWDEPVTLKDGDWVTVGQDDNNKTEAQRSGGAFVVPAILDPNNTEHFLCIKDDTKTGYRIAVPLSPESHDWVKEFNLLRPFNLPDIKNPLKKQGKSESSFVCTKQTCHWFKRKGYGFTPHDLRHAYNHRGHQSGYNPKALADSLGHSIQMNSNNYLRHMSDKVKLQGNKDYFYFSQYRHETDEKDPNNPDTVHYFGAEGSKKLVRVYNHKNKSLRLETQFRGNRAQVAFNAIATLERGDENDEEWSKIVQKTIGGIAIGAIDFRDKSKLKNQSKADKSKTKRLPFWQDFIDNIGVIHLIKIPKTTIDMSSHQATFNWFEKYASKTLAKAFHILGESGFINYVYRLIKLGESRFTPQDLKQIKYLKNNLEHLDLG